MGRRVEDEEELVPPAKVFKFLKVFDFREAAVRGETRQGAKTDLIRRFEVCRGFERNYSEALRLELKVCEFQCKALSYEVSF